MPMLLWCTAATAVVLLATLPCSVVADSCDVPNPSKQDCGFIGIDQNQCLAKGCCWVPEGTGSQTPWCYFQGSGPSPSPSPSPSPPGPPPPPPPPGPPGPLPPPVPAPGSPPFNASEVAMMTTFFKANINIQGSGGVVASPDTNTGPGGSYYFHWARDGALSMHALQLISNGTDYVSAMTAYMGWVVARHDEQDPNGIDVRTEPKYELPSGAVFPGGWCRPQTDGPGLRAITLISFANAMPGSPLIRQYLWTNGGQYNGGAVKYDLDWLAQNWASNTCDLWEEVQSNDFFWNRYTMRKALTLGSAFAQSMGDASSAAAYANAAIAINATLARHYNGQFVFEADNRQQDAAVICAFNNGYMNDGIFSPAGPEVAGTVNTLTQLFHNTFPINQQDDSAGIPGVLYGRYQGDGYDGGNPWVLTSGCLAELFYRGAAEAAQMATIPTTLAQRWTMALSAQRGVRFLSSDLTVPANLAKALASAGDGVLLRIRYHTAYLNFHQPEQIDKNSGLMTSAYDLTWSYATILKAMQVRSQAMDVLVATNAMDLNRVNM